MLKEIEKYYSAGILDQAAGDYGLSRDQLKPIGSNTDIVHEYRVDDQAYILKLIHSSQASSEMVSGEVDWAHYLAVNDVPVCGPVLSKKGNLVEVVDADSSYFTVVAYEKARGSHVGYEDDVLNAELFQTCGKVVGRIHALSKEYVPSDPAIRRPRSLELKKREYFPPELDALSVKRDQLREQFKNLPTDRESYGMVHGDFHAFNFSVHEEGISVFDFGECCYDWFAEELAIVVYHVLDLPYMGEDYDGFGRFFMKNFLQTYRRENHLDSWWASQMNAFLIYREISIYTFIYNNWDLSKYPEDAKWMDAARKRIDHNIPIVDMEYEFG